MQSSLHLTITPQNPNSFTLTELHPCPIATLIFSSTGHGAYRRDNGTWLRLDTGFEVNSAIAHNQQAYIVYPVDGSSYSGQRLHLSILDLAP